MFLSVTLKKKNYISPLPFMCNYHNSRYQTHTLSFSILLCRNAAMRVSMSALKQNTETPVLF